MNKGRYCWPKYEHKWVRTLTQVTTSGSDEPGSEFDTHTEDSPLPAPKISISIVVPAYNEEERIGNFLDSLVNAVPNSTEIIVVCDGDDHTPEKVRSVGGRVRLLQFGSRLGKGGAILEGFKVAKGETIGFVDADGSISASEAVRLALMTSEQEPCVIGSRWVKGSYIVRQEPFLNVIAGRAFHFLTFLILGLGVKDTQCGVKFFHHFTLKSIIKKVTVNGRMIDVALLYQVKLLKSRIIEVGIQWEHKDGTKLRIWKAVPFMFATLVALRVIHSLKARGKIPDFSRISREIRI
jgi:glycosyltransferase involved in cell wall biosynthesis